MARWSRLTASLIAISAAFGSVGACGGSSEVTFRDPDAAAGSGAKAGASGRGGSAGNDGSAGRGGASGSAGRGGASGSASGGTNGSAGTAGVSGSAGRGGTNGSAGTAGAGGSAGRGGTSGSAGRGGTSGSAGTAGASGTAGTGGSPDGGVCPATIPTAGSVCAPNGLSCHYGDCCPVAANCTGGQWQVLATPCIPPICPQNLPRNGDACNPCQDASPCRYDRCGPDNVVSVASCNAQTKIWQVVSAPCETPCGTQGMICDSDEICVRRSGGAGFNYQCQDNPCAPQPVTCGCAASLCGQSPWVCSSATDELVTCSCLTCT